MEAAVLSGNEKDSELLISLDLLIKWNLVPEGFPNITLNGDRINAPPIRLKLDPKKDITPRAH